MSGIAALATETGPKRLELLHRLVPAARTLALLLDPNDGNLAIQTHDLQDAAQTLGLTLRIQLAGSERDLEGPQANLAGADALMIGTSSFFNVHSEQLAAMCARLKLPAIFYTRAFTLAGGLMSYGASFPDMYRQMGVYAGRIDDGAGGASQVKPSNATRMHRGDSGDGRHGSWCPDRPPRPSRTPNRAPRR